MLCKKHVLSAVMVGFASLLIAKSAAADFYLGGQIGYGMTHQPGFSNANINSALATATSPSYTNSNSYDGLAGRVFAGYEFTQYIAAEMGYTKFNDSIAKFIGTAYYAGTASGFDVNTRIRTYAVDLVAKGRLPIQYGWSLVGKLGMAYLRETGEGVLLGTKPLSVSKSSDSGLRPTFGAGLSYELTKSFTADLAWSRIQTVGDTNLKSTDFVGLGLIYHFG